MRELICCYLATYIMERMCIVLIHRLPSAVWRPYSNFICVCVSNKMLPGGWNIATSILLISKSKTTAQMSAETVIQCMFIALLEMNI